jgi:LuxR family quorum-sensing transcriptional regulator LasR
VLELFETLAPLGKADDESSWCDTLWTVGRQMGFEQMLFAALPRPGLEVGNAFLRSNYAAQWRHNYDAQRMVQIDPTVAHCFTRTVPLLWAPDLFSTPAQKSMYEEACGFGLRSGITLPMHGPKGEAGMLCFVTDAATSPQLMRDFQNCLGQLTLVRDIAFDSAKRFLEGHAVPSIPSLTPRERECLRWTAQGKSSWDIANIFKCSEATVDFHIANIRQKFGVSSRRAAAVKAAQLGLIDLS